MSNSTFRTISANQIDGISATRNYIGNGAATDNTAGWATYADAAAASPSDGTGGSPSVTWTRSTSSPLSLDASFIFTKGASNLQGNGASYDFTIQSCDQAKVLQISFDYAVASGTFAAGISSSDSDITVWIYDVTNAQVIQPSTYKLFASSSVSTQFISNFQTASNSTSYRLILHCSTTSASAYTLKVDNVSVAPTSYVYGSPISDWTNTLTFTPNNFGTVSNQSIWTRRVGDSLQVRGSFQGGSSVGSTASVTLPYTIDNSKFSSQTNISILGNYARALSASEYLNANNAMGVIFYDGSDTSKIYFGGGASSAQFTKLNANSIVGSSDKVSFEFFVPIQGWASTVQTSDQADNRITAATIKGAAANSTANNPIIWPTVVKDTHSAYNATTGKYTLPSSGYYQIVVYLNCAPAANAVVSAYLDGVAQEPALGVVLTASGVVTVSGVIYGNGGQLLDIRASQNINSHASNSGWSVNKIQSPSIISATETVAASYWVSSNFSASTSTPINFDSREFDTHGAVTTSPTAWKFTAPVAGTYQISCQNYISSGSNQGFVVYKSGTAYKFIGNSTSGSGVSNTPSTLLKLNANEYIDIRPTGSVTIGGGALKDQSTANINILRVGN